jgi:dihydroneopterin aldolase
MAAQFTIALKGLRFFAGHGLYDDEVLVGNEFEVDISLDYSAPGKTVSYIDQTVNYVEVYQIVQEEFQLRKHLLETNAIHIADRLEQKFSIIEKISISIRKLNPPITNFTGSVGITYTRIREK